MPCHLDQWPYISVSSCEKKSQRRLALFEKLGAVNRAEPGGSAGVGHRAGGRGVARALGELDRVAPSAPGAGLKEDGPRFSAHGEPGLVFDRERVAEFIADAADAGDATVNDDLALGVLGQSFAPAFFNS